MAYGNFFHIFSQKEKSETKIKKKIKIKTNKNAFNWFPRILWPTKSFPKIPQKLDKFRNDI